MGVYLYFRLHVEAWVTCDEHYYTSKSHVNQLCDKYCFVEISHGKCDTQGNPICNEGKFTDKAQ